MASYDPQYSNYEFNDQTNFDFQSFDQQNTYSPYSPQEDYSFSTTRILSPREAEQGYDQMNQTYDAFESEPPLLDELEIYPARILEKSLAVLNPCHKQGLTDDPEYLFKENDLAGPVTFCLTLAVCLFLSGSKIQFGYIYGLSVISVLVMYCLMKLMIPSTTVDHYITLSSIASILGYSILPIVWLSMLGVFIALNSKLGMILAGLAVFLATAASSRIFCLMSGDKNQRYLLAYPCSLVYVIFVLLVLF